MTDREPEVRHSMLNDEYVSEDPPGDTQRRRFSPETPTTTRIESSTELTILATTMQMMVQLLERQMGAPANSVNGANENATIQMTTMPDLTATLPTFSGTDDSLNEWVTSVENMRERCSWNDMATLNAGISRLRGRAAAWHRMDGVNLNDWHTWVAALRKEFDKQPLFCEWVESVNARREKDDENITDYMYSRLQRIGRGKYALSDDDIVDWLIQGVRSETAKPMLAAFHDLRKGSVSDFISSTDARHRREAKSQA
ncbi:hypothetical protein HPB50_022439 [Hyalomma asiaticum]|uniref:Uncharacterized protein n=1 Tax=Hyalomma asiaticum TaxID=266040 RepID=A0ACB7TLQ5_HYAAI|nr:hypothetical protein HPB50_022439 [Hyalomma asiaticum]